MPTDRARAKRLKRGTTKTRLSLQRQGSAKSGVGGVQFRISNASRPHGSANAETAGLVVKKQPQLYSICMLSSELRDAVRAVTAVTLVTGQ